MTVLSLLFLFIPQLRKIFWMDNMHVAGKNKSASFLRLRMLVYEPSYYSTLMSPVMLYYLLKRLSQATSAYFWVYYLAGACPLFLSLSFGVILAMATALLILLIMNSRQVIFNKNNIPLPGRGPLSAVGSSDQY